MPDISRRGAIKSSAVLLLADGAPRAGVLPDWAKV